MAERTRKTRETNHFGTKNMIAKNDLRDFCLYSTFLLVTAMFFVQVSDPTILTTGKSTFEYDSKGIVVCDTNSMGLTLRCDDEAYISEAQSFIRGAVYTYNYTVNETNNLTLVHRLVGCYTINNGSIIDDTTCSDYLVFMGDNNPFADEIQTVNSAEYGHVDYVRYAR